MKLVDRRTALTILAAAALPSPTRAADAAPEYSDEEVVKILLEEAQDAPLATEATLGSFWFQKPEGQRPSPNWPQDNIAYDYAHLARYVLPSEEFELTAQAILDYISLCSYEPNTKEKLLFGIRGCVLPDPKRVTDFAAAHIVRDIRPDHINNLCLLGVLDFANKKIALFAGSTVPNVDLMEMQARGLLACNMLPTGMHTYRVGAHKRTRQPGAFRQQASVWVHRAKGMLEYSLDANDNIWDDLDGALPADNIHAAILNYRRKPPYFSSAGCQVVEGAYGADGAPIGPWADFRRHADLSHPPVLTDQNGASTDDGREFSYVLVTGKEAHVLATMGPAPVESLRYGSEGKRVEKLQDVLLKAAVLDGSYQRGKIDRKTMGALIKWQGSQRLPPTGILARADAQSLDVW